MNRTHSLAAILAVATALAGAAPAARPAEPAAAAEEPGRATRLVPSGRADSVAYMIPFDQLVTAPRQALMLRQNPAATTLLGRQELAAMPRGVSADEALLMAPGVRVDNQWHGGLVHLSIRGQGILTEAGIRGIHVLLDGVPLNDPTGVAPDLLDVDWATVDHVEVLRGPSGALYGGGGAGGVLNIVSASGGPGAIAGSVSARAGSNGFWKSTVGAGGTSGDVNYRVSFSRTGGDGYRVHSAFDGDNAWEKVSWAPARGIEITQLLGWSSHLDENPEGLTAGQAAQDPTQPNPDALAFNEFFRTSRVTTGLSGRFEIAPGHTLRASASYRETRYRESVPSSVDHRTLLTPGVSAQYDVDTRAGRSWRNHLSVGFDAQWQDVDQYVLQNLGWAVEGTLLANQHWAQRGAGVFVLDRLELGERWGLMAGARYDDIHNDLSDLLGDSRGALSGTADAHRATARAGVAWTPREEANLYANWSQGFLPPSTEELGSNPDRIGGLNRNLVPATSWSGEVGARGRLGGSLSYDLALFHMVTDHDFDRYRIESRPLETFYRNVGSSRRNGLEALLKFRPAPGIEGEVAYTWSDFKYTTTTPVELGEGGSVVLDGKGLPSSPAHVLDAELACQPLEGLTLAVNVEAQSTWWVDSGNTSTAPGFALLGARAGWGFDLGARRVELDVSAKNILAHHYMAFTEPDPDGNSYHPGPEREVFGGLTVRF